VEKSAAPLSRSTSQPRRAPSTRIAPDLPAKASDTEKRLAERMIDELYQRGSNRKPIASGLWTARFPKITTCSLKALPAQRGLRACKAGAGGSRSERLMKPTNAFVAELVRDMYNVHYARKSGAGGLDYIQHVIVETPTYRGGCGTSWKP